MRSCLYIGVATILFSGCGPVDDHSPEPTLPYATNVVSVSIGDGAGYGEDEMPDVVLGPPEGAGTVQSGLDVLSLGVGGEIVVGFGERVIRDGEGADFVVYENPFWAGGDPENVFAELGEVSVSADGEFWQTFHCDTDGMQTSQWPGCAGWRPVLEFDATSATPIDPDVTGGDAFDLEDVGVERARFVRIRDLSEKPNSPNSSGFDLDAVGVINVVVE